ncbi:MAG: ECF-type sigma factor [Phycisphaerae bacterium]|nr:ECF-type sigma factor [Phycisphaerae bacterium]
MSDNIQAGLPREEPEFDALFGAVYSELHAVAAAIQQRHRPISSAQTTSLVNDAYVRLVDRGIRFQDRTHFLNVAARAMRNALIDRARNALAAKRGNGATRIALHDDIAIAADEPDLLALNDALLQLAAIDPAKSRLVELRYFGGLSIEETAQVMGQSPATLKREWALARAWLYRALSDPDTRS